MGKTELMKVMYWLDEMRWCSESNYNLIRNEYFANLSDDKKILVHWILYITDRQMPFEKIWKEGGYVFSGIVNEFACGCSYHSLESFVQHDQEKLKFSYDGHSFASRFVSTDLKCILLTLRNLSIPDYDRNIVTYINKTFNVYKHLVIANKALGANNINLIAFILYLLSYKHVKNNQGADEKRTIKHYFTEVDNFHDSFKQIINDQIHFNKEYREFIKNRFDSKKRVWCSVRDYLKSKEFHKCFINALAALPNNEYLSEIMEDESEQFNLELPGDVWNLKSSFIDNLVVPNLGLKSTNYSKALREALQRPYYPELFDLTFDFVPRMCSSPANLINNSMCKICFFGNSGMGMYCHKDKNMACPVLMISCGYFSMCVPEKCPIAEKIGIGICREMT